ncbi:YciI family protein [Solirubrobacter phytolaccae]|uniref:YciI family protein n=1 Tax=Solirubrobacter phytolaccae TaxID=1404360 RepID=A0A9X3S6P2_9ACTN|nr:YciI family protein [Solirubrobacter phytolaccae]MDA0180139.1 YciI family protein [Solirubrobacter phytolaccae]
MPQTLQLLQYEYVSDMAEKRAPHRAAHLSLIEEYHAEGKLVIAGALGDPPHSGLLAFASAEAAAAFAEEDPYGAAGLVVSKKIEPWTVVVS